MKSISKRKLFLFHVLIVWKLRIKIDSNIHQLCKILTSKWLVRPWNNHEHIVYILYSCIWSITFYTVFEIYYAIDGQLQLCDVLKIIFKLLSDFFLEDVLKNNWRNTFYDKISTIWNSLLLSKIFISKKLCA